MAAHKAESHKQRTAQVLALEALANTSQHFDKNWAYLELERLNAVRAKIVQRSNASRIKFKKEEACAQQRFYVLSDEASSAKIDIVQKCEIELNFQRNLSDHYQLALQ